MPGGLFWRRVPIGGAFSCVLTIRSACILAWITSWGVVTVVVVVVNNNDLLKNEIILGLKIQNPNAYSLDMSGKIKKAYHNNNILFKRPQTALRFAFFLSLFFTN